MVTIKVWIVEGGCLERFEAEGHTEGCPEGQDIVCAAVTILLRTCAHALKGTGAFVATKEGRMEFDVDNACNIAVWLRGVTHFLMTGLMDLQTEYPKQVKVIYAKEPKELI